MTDYRNILRLHSLEHSQREMERELSCSRHTIAEVLVQAAAAGISWPLDDSITNEDIQEILFPGRYAFASPYTVPDFQYIHEELAKKGVTLTLLWEAYCQRVSAMIRTVGTSESIPIPPRIVPLATPLWTESSTTPM